MVDPTPETNLETQHTDYVARLQEEIRRPEWRSDTPPWPPETMWGTCRNDDCETGILETEDVAVWRTILVNNGNMVVYQAFCHACYTTLAVTHDAAWKAEDCCPLDHCNCPPAFHTAELHIDGVDDGC